MHVAHACSQFSEHSQSLHRRTHMCVYTSRCGRFSANRQLSCKVPWFRGSSSGIRGFGGVLPSAVSGAIFRNRGFPTFPLGQYPRGRRIPVNSHAGYGRTGTNREIPTVLPHHPHTTARIPASPASTDTDNSPNVGRRFCRHRQPPPRQQTLLPTLTADSTSVDGSGGRIRERKNGRIAIVIQDYRNATGAAPLSSQDSVSATGTSDSQQRSPQHHVSLYARPHHRTHVLAYNPHNPDSTAVGDETQKPSGFRGLICAPDRIRTCNLLIRSQLL